MSETDRRLRQQPAFAAAFASYNDGEQLTQPQPKLLSQMGMATARLAELEGLSQVVAGLHTQYQEAQHHFVAHSASQLALADAKKAMEGVDLPESAALALEFLTETAEKGVARAKARAKEEEEEKSMRKAEKEVKAEKLRAAQAAAAKGRPKQLGRGQGALTLALALLSLLERRSLLRSPHQTGRGAHLQCWNCGEWGHHQNDCMSCAGCDTLYVIILLVY
ncbi:hypothetical protein CYMTET_28771 [Cymbomonas tetramitiformis]|uniref:CCHC-type domain-containing protein n=1 Tax=Cymbomonas tetramitiformis TaxID=36881 RepID=A0AAE0KVW7_9CHLO|nr:hypothetical protein CYMTET_28771 [Cymbomonas tetramitiformis]